mmetsp:Transcript_3891/g.13707  ORF Transcript_3891/g.13707 Transcript_3891/m.13707 type:complete len:295 (-) Transcript_3891:837-1721(-)
MRISPFFGVQRLAWTPMSAIASARASSVCGTCRFISSPSKSALYGAHTHSLKRNVRHGITRTLCAMMDILWSEGWRLKSAMSPFSRWRSTMSPYLSSDASRRRSPYLRNWRVPFCRTTKLAPGCTSIPLRTHCRSFSMLCRETRSGYVMMSATWRGTPTSSTRRFGSGEMTVRPLKSTRFPERLPRKRPCFPLRRCTNPRMGFAGWYAIGSPGNSLLMYVAHCTWSPSQTSIVCCTPSPSCRHFRSVLLFSMICISFIVMSSSLLPPVLSMSTLGRMHTGGTGRCVKMRCSGRP